MGDEADAAMERAINEELHEHVLGSEIDKEGNLYMHRIWNDMLDKQSAYERERGSAWDARVLHTPTGPITL
jgi:hypothetical protein